MTSQLETWKRQKEHFVRDFFLQLWHFEGENWQFSYNYFYKAQKIWFLRRFRQFSRHSQNAALATTFDTASCLRSPDIALHEDSSFATFPNAAPATKIDDAAAQSAATATKNRHANWDTLLNYCACRAKRTHNRNPCYKTQENNAISDEIDLQEMILSHFKVVSAAQRWGLGTPLRSPANGCERSSNAGRTQLQHPDLQS